MNKKQRSKEANKYHKYLSAVVKHSCLLENKSIYSKHEVVGAFEKYPELSRDKKLELRGSIDKKIIQIAEQIGRKIITIKDSKLPKVAKNQFLKTYEWRKLRLQALQKHGRKCQCCGATPESGAIMHVDHIKPRKRYPELALDLDNLQILCHECNHGKGNWNETDFRKESEERLNEIGYMENMAIDAEYYTRLN